jgi:peptidoglycan/LPS O-acetylase OafA/YrhL
MPLFFLLSGFFTSMLWQRRGLASLIKHRARHIALPLFVGLFTVLPAVVVGALIAAMLPAGAPLVQPESATGPEFSFAHMWFLWYLLWLLAAFAAVAALATYVTRHSAGARILWPLSLKVALWLLPLVTIVPQLMMGAGSTEPAFGPDTDEGLLPALRILAYYATFFAFGTLLFLGRDRSHAPLVAIVGRRWRVLLPAATLLIFPAALAATYQASVNMWPAAAVLQTAYAWTMSFALIGLFHHFLATERYWIRFMSDASYYMYLMHLPLVFVAQGVVAAWPVPALLKFLLICVAVFALLLLSYRYLVRYTIVGRLLNGVRTKEQDGFSRGEIRGDTNSGT